MESQERNNEQIINIDEFKKFELEFNNSIEFLQKFSNLLKFSGRIIPFVTKEKVHIVHSALVDSGVQTLKSIKLCCSLGNFSDANTLIRKLRDDLLLYVYILAITNQRIPFTEKSIQNFSIETSKQFEDVLSNIEFTELTNDEKAVAAWLSNQVLELINPIKKKLSFENYMTVLKLNTNISNVLSQYNLENYWEFLRTKLNNYVHNNGSQFAQHNLVEANNSQLENYFQNINTRSSYVITFFIVLIIMVDSTLICSSEVEDYLDLGINPPENIQYEIAPFIQEFINEKVVNLHPELKEYLKTNNSHGMKIE